jgi:hypothetical protein
MTLKDFWSKASSWLKTHKPSRPADYQPEIDNEGLISQGTESTGAAEEKPAESNPYFAPHNGASDFVPIDGIGTTPDRTQGKQVLVKTVPPADKTQTLEKLQAGFDKLVEQLEGINNHLNRQAAHNEELMKRLEQLPKLLESFPAVVENRTVKSNRHDGAGVYRDGRKNSDRNRQANRCSD